MIKLSNEDVLQAKMGRRLGFPPTSVNTVIKNKEFLVKLKVLLHWTLL
jgi:hypothetical protein